MQRIKILRIALIIGLACLSLLGTANAQRKAAAQKKLTIDLPMQFISGRPAVEVMVNGKGPFLFLIDTGADGLARADTSLVKKLNLPIIGKENNDDRSGNIQSVNQVRLDTITIGSISFQNVTAKSRDYNTTPRIDGILGFNLFSDYLLTLDYPNKKVRLEQGSLPKPNGKNILSFETPNGTPLVKIRFGKLSAKADIDSGDSEGISLPASLVNKMVLLSQPKIVGKGKSANSTFEIKEVNLREAFRIGSYEFPEPTVVYTEVFDNINLGSKILREFSFTFDQKNQRVRFVRQKTAN
jgi:predicted aspartyl protease